MMPDLAWIVGFFVAIAYFAVWETLAFKYPGRFNSLSHVVFTIGLHWPLAIFIMGTWVGGLATHFFWHWCPPGSISTGSLLVFLGIG